MVLYMIQKKEVLFVVFLAWYRTRSGDSEFKGCIEEKVIQFNIHEIGREHLNLISFFMQIC
jgi:hypothetical protein